MRMIKKHSIELGFGADSSTWKAFRAGHATHLAMRGSKINVIMQAGEWKSITFPDYVDRDAIDVGELLNAILDASDNEGDD